MLKVGIVGFGFMGRMHFRHWKMVPDVKIVAICDANPNIKEDTKKAVGNIAGAEGDIDLESVELFRDLEEMLAKVKPDVISLTLPTYLHAECSEKALSQGVHVLCEKPMALTVTDCDRMIQAARKSGKVLQIGHCVRFWPEYAKAKEIVDSGKYGRRRGGDVPAAWGGAGLERGQLVHRRETQRRCRPGPAHPRHGLRAVPLRHAPGRVQPRGQGAGRAVDPHGHRPTTTAKTG